MLSGWAWCSLTSSALVARLSVPALITISAPISIAAAISNPAWIAGLALITRLARRALLSSRPLWPRWSWCCWCGCRIHVAPGNE
jgi:hypothetical protein